MRPIESKPDGRRNNRNRPAQPTRLTREEAIRHFRLNTRQVDLLDLLARGTRDKTAAQMLGMTETTEHKAVKTLFDKFEAVLPERSRVALAVLWNGLGSGERK